MSSLSLFQSMLLEAINYSYSTVLTAFHDAAVSSLKKNKRKREAESKMVTE
jgi:hypothetical protein